MARKKQFYKFLGSFFNKVFNQILKNINVVQICHPFKNIYICTKISFLFFMIVLYYIFLVCYIYV